MEQPLPPTLSFVDPSAGRRPRVLVVDDHPVNRQALRIMLGGRVELHEAVNGAEGLEAARTWNFDAILMDLHMPVMNGPDAIRAIRDLEAGGSAHASIALMVPATVDGLDHLAQDCGADLYLARPLGEDAVLRVIDAAAPGRLGESGLSALGAAA
ncbi:MAG: response regulator [Caulobacteraceae bacterium]|nr:response regulator [Caulobacteraceae bacterium]